MTTGQKFFEPYRAPLLELCRRYPVEQIYLFGSILTDDFDPERSDVDVQIFFDRSGDPADLGTDILNLWDDLETLFGRKVDMISTHPIRNPYLRKSVESSRQLFYERKHEEIFV